MDPPATTTGRVGEVVLASGTFRSRQGVVLAEGNQGTDVLYKGTAPVTVQPAEFGRLGPVKVPGPAMTTPVGRLWQVITATRRGTVSGKWAIETVEEAAATLAGSGSGSGIGIGIGIGLRRAAALDALALGEPSRLSGLSLTASELSWYRARAAALNGDPALMLGHLEELPPGAYPGQVQLMLASVPGLLGHRDLSDRARNLLDPFCDTRRDAAILAIALRDEADDVLTQLGELAETVDAAAGTVLHVPAAAALSDDRPLDPAAAPTPAAAAWSLYLGGRNGVTADGRPRLLARLPEVLLDELIQAGALTTVPTDADGWDENRLAYLQVRLRPEAASWAQLRRAGGLAEIARRRFLEGDGEGLESLSGEDPDVLHYRALLQLSRSVRPERIPGLRPATAEQAAELSDLLTQLAEGVSTQPSERIATDPTCWRFLRAAAQSGTLKLGDDLRTSYPEFAAWADLCVLQQLVFEGEWAVVARRGRELANRSRLETLTDEAMNMVAFAEFQLGRTNDALRLLDLALAGQFTNGLVVNASVVAADSGCLSALPYLLRAYQVASEPLVRRGALNQAIALWLNDKKVAGQYPVTLAELVREALQNPPEADLHRTLLLMACLNDDAWLAGQNSLPAGEGQRVAVNYFRTRARVTNPDYSEDLESMARALVSLQTVPPIADWVVQEQEQLTKLLMEMVHVDFGKAPHLAPAIRALVSGKVLSLAEELILAIQAGTHTAVSLEDTDTCIAPALERALIFDTIAKYGRRREELSHSANELVADELARCIGRAGLSMALFTGNRFDVLGDEWGQLVDRRNWDYQNVSLISRRQGELLDELDFFVQRMRAYLAAMENLPLTEQGREMKPEFAASVRSWSAEISRLRRFV